MYRKQNAKGTKKRRRLHIRRIVLFSLLLVILAGLLLKIPAMTMEYIREDTFSPLQRYRTATIDRSEMASGELILVNSSYAYSFDQPDQTVPIASEKNDSYQVKDEEIRLNEITIRQFNRLFRAFERSTGLSNVRIISAFRDYAYQDGLFQERVSDLGYYEAIHWVAVPGYSEHHTGYAADIAVADEEGNTATFTGEGDYAYIEENAWRYGFIRRFPENKTDLTGVANEPWHYRYVGKAHAYIMYMTGMCLEEYVEYVKSYPYGEKYIDVNIHGDEYKIYYVPAGDAEQVEVPVPLFGSYEISGNNVDGFIVTEKD